MWEKELCFSFSSITPTLLSTLGFARLLASTPRRRPLVIALVGARRPFNCITPEFPPPFISLAPTLLPPANQTMAEIGSPTNESLKSWWKHFTVVQRMKKPDISKGLGRGCAHHVVESLILGTPEEPQRVFGVPLRLSLSYASVQISTANQNGSVFWHISIHPH